MPGSRPSCRFASLLFAALTAVGCSTQGEPGGSLALELTLGGGVEIDTVAWTITGGDMDPMSDQIDTSAPGSTASVEVFGIPEGIDYLIVMTATATDQVTECQGSALFDVQVGVATPVHVMLNCLQPERFGGVRADGWFNLCAELTKVVVSPLQTSVGYDITLTSDAVDGDGDDEAVAYKWMGTGGSIADPSLDDTTYTCLTAGNHSVTIQVSDDDFTYCVAEWTVAVTCVPGDGDMCEDVTCPDLGECKNNTCSQVNGQCQESNVSDGTDCDGGSCMGGECVPTDLCAEVTCPDLGECKSNTCDPADGMCDEANLPDGTDCVGGMCSNGSCIPADLCVDVTCPDLGECKNNLCNPADGICAESNVSDGTDCDGGSCMGGECVPTDLCAEVTCPDLGECKSNTCDPADGMCDEANVANGSPCTGGSCTDGTCVLDQSTLSVEKTGPPAAFANQEIDFTITVTNIAPQTANNVVVVDSLPAEGSFISSNPTGTLNGNALTVDLGSILPNDSAVVTVTWLTPNNETTLVNSAEATADGVSAAADSHTLDIGLQTVVTGGVTAAGTGLRNRDNGDITIVGVPEGAIVTRAVLVWALLYQNPVPGNQITFEGELITADITQTISDDLCWEDDATIGFAADVTHLVSGNGVYAVTDPINGVIREDDVSVPVFPVTDGASLFVFYGGPGIDAQVLSDFSYSAESDSTNLRTVSGIESTGQGAMLYLAGPDGQSFGEEVRITGFGVLNFDDSWNGSDPQEGPDFSLIGGSLWDTDIHDVSSILPIGQTTLDINLGFGSDCTGISAVALEVQQ